jgi:hypothetical protein
LEKNCQIFQKVVQKVSTLKNAQMIPKNIQNIYIKPLLKPKNTYNNPCFECAYLGESVTDLLYQKYPKMSIQK